MRNGSSSHCRSQWEGHKDWMINEALLGLSCCGHCECMCCGRDIERSMDLWGVFTLIRLSPELQCCVEMTTAFIISLVICIDKAGLQYKTALRERIMSVCSWNGVCLLPALDLTCLEDGWNMAKPQEVFLQQGLFTVWNKTALIYSEYLLSGWSNKKEVTHTVSLKVTRGMIVQ